MKFKGGRIPYGFLVSNGELVFDIEGSGPILAQIMKWNTFEGVRPIANSLVSQNVPSPSGGEWNYGSVARVIKRGKELSHLIPFEYAI